jgi:hypothetical protein
MTVGLFFDWSQKAFAARNQMSMNTVAPTLFLFSPKNSRLPMRHHHLLVQDVFRLERTNERTECLPPCRTLSSLIIGDYGPIDQTIIGDSPSTYLVFAGDNSKIYHTSMSVGNFPGDLGMASITVSLRLIPSRTCSRPCRYTPSRTKTGTS